MFLLKFWVGLNAKNSTATPISRALPDELKGNRRVHIWIARISDVKLLDAGQWLNATHELLPISVWDAGRYIAVQLHHPKLLVGRVRYWMVSQRLKYPINGFKLIQFLSKR